MVNVPKWNHSILWEVCILIYSLIALIFISYSYVDHRWKFLLFIQIHVGYWWRVSLRHLAIFIKLWNHVQAVDALALGSPFPQVLLDACTGDCREASVLTSDSFVNDEKASLKHISLMYLAKAYEKIQGRVKNLSGWRSWPSDVNRSCFSIPSQSWWGDSIHITCFCHFPPLKSENILKIVFSSGNVAEQKWVVKIYVECY